MEPHDRADILALISTELLERVDGAITTNAIVERAVTLLEDADHASLTVVAEPNFKTLASTSDLATDADHHQYDLGEGPCVDSSMQGEWFRSGDVGQDPRWPRWGPIAASLGVGSLLSIRMLSHREPFGALNLYSQTPGRFADTDEIELALLYAVHAANALVASQLVTNLETAMSSRHEIGVAQGILMGRYGLDLEAAFAVLRRVSQDTNSKLRDVAATVVRTGTLPGAPAPGADQHEVDQQT